MTNQELRRLVYCLRKRIIRYERDERSRVEVINNVCDISDYQRELIRQLKRECVRLRVKIVDPKWDSANNEWNGPCEREIEVSHE